VRINQLPLGLKDLEEIVPESPDLILIPKVEKPDQVIDASRKIADINANSGITRPIWLMPILESALGIEKAYEIATALQSILGQIAYGFFREKRGILLQALGLKKTCLSLPPSEVVF